MKILNDFNTSVEKALSEIDPKWRNYKGLIICGTHTPVNVEQMIDDITGARKNNIPFLGICFGHQLAAIEYARNVLGHRNATSEEFGLAPYHSPNDKPEFVVVKLPQLQVGFHGGESYWNNYEVLPKFLNVWKKPDNFMTCQFHPEYQSSKDHPHPLLVTFIEICKSHE